MKNCEFQNMIDDYLLDHLDEEKAEAQAQGQAEDVDEGIPLVPAEVPQGDDDVVLEHARRLLIDLGEGRRTALMREDARDGEKVRTDRERPEKREGKSGRCSPVSSRLQVFDGLRRDPIDVRFPGEEERPPVGGQAGLDVHVFPLSSTGR